MVGETLYQACSSVHCIDYHPGTEDTNSEFQGSLDNMVSSSQSVSQSGIHSEMSQKEKKKRWIGSEVEITFYLPAHL